MIKAVDLRKGKTVLHEGELCIVHEAQHVAKGNKRSYMQTKLKNFKSCIISDVRFSVDDRLEVPYVEQEVTDAPPVVRGATATNQMKEAVVETGAKVRVPPFIEIGNRICIDTRSGEY